MDRVAELIAVEDRKTAARLEEELDFIEPVLRTIHSSQQRGLPDSFELSLVYKLILRILSLT